MNEVRHCFSYYRQFSGEDCVRCEDRGACLRAMHSAMEAYCSGENFVRDCCDNCEHNANIFKDFAGTPVLAQCTLACDWTPEVGTHEAFVYAREDAPDGCPYKLQEE